jgi:hypothetical protein
MLVGIVPAASSDLLLSSLPCSSFSNLLLLAAGPSFRYGMNSAISPDGSTIAVATATQVNANNKVVFMYRRLANSGSRYQLVDTVPMGDMVEDPWTGASDYYNALDANIAVNPNGNLLSSVENGILMLYQVRSRITGTGSSARTQLDWQRRCQIQPPAGYRFRGSECVVGGPGGGGTGRRW